MGSVAYVEEERKELVKDVLQVARLGVCLMSISDSCVTVQNGSQSTLIAKYTISSVEEDLNSLLVDYTF